MDYVVVHELAHRKYMNHSKEFWAEVKKYCPEYKERKKCPKKIHIRNIEAYCRHILVSECYGI